MLYRPFVCSKRKRDAYWALPLIGIGGLLSSPGNHRGFWRVCNQVARWTPPGAACVVELNQGAYIQVSLDDPYWSRLLAKSYDHEPELHRGLKRLAGLDYTLIDCGANFGYWSILASSEAYGSKEVLAIEAAPSTYQALVSNCGLNGNRFRCFHRAVTAVSGDRVAVRSESGHEGATITSEYTCRDATVETVSLNSFAERHLPDVSKRRPLLVKLDVEGQEINALKGAGPLLDWDIAFCYEDHGKDPDAKVTRFVLEDLGLSVMYLYPRGKQVTIRRVEDALRVKRRRSHGYNFFAFRPETSFGQLLC